MARGTPLVDREAPPPMTDADYDAALKALDQERRALELAHTVSQTYPRWAYHATEPAHLVYSDAEAEALGEGWSATPLGPDEAGGATPVVTALEPDTVAIGAPSFTLTVRGSGFVDGSVIVFNGYDEPTTIVSDTAVTTGVDMSVWTAPSAPLPVGVRNPDGQESAPLTFTFTAAGRRG